ncbi:AAEL010114-PA [Aedes aegypti]|uniref:AAEL010114-PA n=1 Tax=Aedes aegypti TaxID=7159 RepID=Q16TX2_AEDAE|nr:AAEL010114-PA [Aedes aegypti]
MAANSGVKIFRDILRDSPCRMAYMMSQSKNFTQQYSKNHHLGKSIPLERPGTARPKTAPIAASSLAHAITAHNLMPETVMKQAERPTTSVRTVKPSINLICTGTRKPDGKPSRRPEAPPRQRPRRPANQSSRKTPPASNSKQDIRKRPHQQSSKLESPNTNRDSPKRPCKICISGEDCSVPEQWQDLLNEYSTSTSSPSSDGFRHLIGEIEAIRSELVAREDMKNISLQDSLELINEIQQRINSVFLSNGTSEGSFLNRLEPFQTATLGVEKRSTIKARKSVRSLHFEGGRIIEEDYTKGSRQPDGGRAVVRKAKTKQIEKKFDEGPLRCLLPLNEGEISETPIA